MNPKPKTIEIEKKPAYKSLTLQGNSLSVVGAIWLIADLLVKPTEMLIADGHIKYIELLPSTLMILIGSVSIFFGRLRKGDLFVGIRPKNKTSAAAKAVKEPVVVEVTDNTQQNLDDSELIETEPTVTEELPDI